MHLLCTFDVYLYVLIITYYVYFDVVWESCWKFSLTCFFLWTRWALATVMTLLLSFVWFCIMSMLWSHVSDVCGLWLHDLPDVRLHAFVFLRHFCFCTRFSLRLSWSSLYPRCFLCNHWPCFVTMKRMDVFLFFPFFLPVGPNSSANVLFGLHKMT